MIRNYLVLFLRNLQRQKLFSVVNLLGLTVSIVSTLVIYLYVRHEFSFDRFHTNADRIYRINQTFIWGEDTDRQFSSTGPGVAYAVKAELTEVDLMTSIHTPGNFFVSYAPPDGRIISFEEDRILAADTNFFRMFTFPILKGDRENLLQKANSIVMTESSAKKYFGDEDPIGKLVQLGVAAGEEQKTYEVTAIVKDIPTNSYIEFDMLLSLSGFPVTRFSWSWVWTQLETFIRLNENARPEDTRAKLSGIPRKHAEQTLQRAFNTTWDDYIKSGKKWELFLQPLTSIHLPEEPVINRLNDPGNLKIIYSFIGAAIFIVLLSCVNFMNLSTAQFTRRIKEASIRKILGLGRAELSFNYFIEALIFCLIALVTGLGVAQLILPGFNLISGKALTLDLFNDPALMALLGGLVLLMALLSSSYPAIFLSAFRPSEAIKGKLKSGHEGKTFRNGLVVFQFSVSIVLIICTAIVFQQLRFVSEKDLGFDKDNLVVINHIEGLSDGETFANAAMNIPGVLNATWCTSVPPRIWGGDTFNVEGTDRAFPLNFCTADEKYLPTLGIELKLGLNFSLDTPGDVNRVIINETAVKRIGWDLDESVLGKKINYGNEPFEVIGVMADFNYWSLQAAIEPMAVFHIKTKQIYDSPREYLTLRVAGQSSEAWEETLGQLQTLWKTQNNSSPFDYEFVDQAFANAFQTEQRFGQMLTLMAGLAILIAGLGLLGMIIYNLEQRTKEIGIRKVSGASVLDIMTLISKGYTRLIILAFILGAPLSYWMMQQWLQEFAFRITPSLWVFGAVGVVTILFAVMITSYHTFKAARRNPVEVLRDE